MLDFGQRGDVVTELETCVQKCYRRSQFGFVD
jgi:hypothetical protein